MRQVLVDAARRRATQKRGGGPAAPGLDPVDADLDSFASELLDLNSALEDLGLESPRHLQVVECRFFGGMSVEETAAALGVSARTIKADWALARVRLRRALDSTGSE
jgi:RNA polymerase sigma factor (TIGR02999 family)